MSNVLGFICVYPVPSVSSAFNQMKTQENISENIVKTLKFYPLKIGYKYMIIQYLNGFRETKVLHFPHFCNFCISISHRDRVLCSYIFSNTKNFIPFSFHSSEDKPAFLHKLERKLSGFEKCSHTCRR